MHYSFYYYFAQSRNNDRSVMKQNEKTRYHQCAMLKHSSFQKIALMSNTSNFMMVKFTNIDYGCTLQQNNYIFSILMSQLIDANIILIMDKFKTIIFSALIVLFLSVPIFQSDDKSINVEIDENFLNYSLSLFLFIMAYLFIKYYFVPCKRQKHMIKMLKKLGYKVYEIPFDPFQIPLLKRFKVAQKQHKDALYYQKYIYPKYDVIVLNFLSINGLCFLNHELIKQFVSADKMIHYKKIHLQGLRGIIGGGIAFSEGQTWKQKRRLLSKIFNFDLLIKNIGNMSKICDNCLDNFQKNYSVKQGEYKFDVMELGNYIYTSIITKCFLGEQQIKDKIDGVDFHIFVNRLFSDATKVSIAPITLLLGQWAYKLGLTHQLRDAKNRVKIFRSIIAEIIEKRKSQFAKKGSSQINDYIEALLQQAIKNSSEDTESKTKEMVDAFGGLLIAGTDTTAHFLTMMVYSIVQNPEVETRLRKQISEVFQTKEDFTIDNLKRMSYVDWIQNQTIRCYSPSVGLFPREVLEDHMIGDIAIKKGMWLTMSSNANHFKEEYFADPHKFRPERWENQCDGLLPYLIMGFGGGPRTCAGKHLALLDSKIALIKIFKRYKRIINPPEHPVMRVTLLYEPHPFETTFRI